MPTYEYRCPNGHEFDLFQKMSDDPVAECPDCGEEAERKLSGGAGFLFKGEGFYITDYRSESYRKAASKEKEAKESGASDASDAGDSSGGSATSGETPSPGASGDSTSSGKDD